MNAAQGVKICAKELDKAIAGMNMLVAYHPDEVEVLKEEVEQTYKAALNAFQIKGEGVFVQASTLGSLEALLNFLRTSKIPVSKTIEIIDGVFVLYMCIFQLPF